MTQYRKENFAPGSADLQKYFAKGALIPAVVQEASTGQVLMLAYMNGKACARLWRPVIPGFTAVPGKNYGIRGPHQAMCRRCWNCGPIAITIPCWCW